jgi:hypothetical protein
VVFAVRQNGAASLIATEYRVNYSAMLTDMLRREFGDALRVEY